MKLSSLKNDFKSIMAALEGLKGQTATAVRLPDRDPESYQRHDPVNISVMTVLIQYYYKSMTCWLISIDDESMASSVVPAISKRLAYSLPTSRRRQSLVLLSWNHESITSYNVNY